MQNFRIASLILSIFVQSWSILATENKNDFDSMDVDDDLQLIQLRPKIRADTFSEGQYYIDRRKILPLITNIYIFKDFHDFQKLPYILGFERGDSIGGVGDKMYAKELQHEQVSTYSIVKPGKRLLNPQTKEDLGLEIKVVGHAEVSRRGEMSTMEITGALDPVKNGDRLMPRVAINLPEVLTVTKSTLDLRGFVVSIGDELYDVGSNGTVLLSFGKNSGVKQGDLFYVVDDNEFVYDPIDSKKVPLPGSVVGEVVVIDTFEKVSLGFVLKTKRAISVNDVVVSNAIR